MAYCAEGNWNGLFYKGGIWNGMMIYDFFCKKGRGVAHRNWDGLNREMVKGEKSNGEMLYAVTEQW